MSSLLDAQTKISEALSHPVILCHRKLATTPTNEYYISCRRRKFRLALDTDNRIEEEFFYNQFCSVGEKIKDFIVIVSQFINYK